MTRYLVALLACLTALGVAQPKPTLQQYLDDLKWDIAAKGPLIAVVSGPKRPAEGQQGLAAYARKLTVIGGATAVVPTKMVVIDDSMKTPPNLYDGLPREAKVLYLLSTFTDGQLSKAGSQGIGLSDLNQEQQAVFISLLPHPFKWGKGIVGESGIPDEKSKGTLSDSQRLKVRLRIAKAINFHLGLADGSRAYTFHNTTEEYGPPGATTWYRDTEDDYDKHEAYGIQIRQEVDNQLKKAHLDYRAPLLQTSIPLKPHETIQSLLTRIGGTTGLELYADLRVEKLDVASYGQKATAAELLQALALGVTGTYRKVEGAYVLTSDLTGMGSRKLRLSFWQSDIQKEIWKRMTDWRVVLKAAGALSKFDYDDDASLAPDPETRKLLDTLKPAEGAESIETTSLSANFRSFIDRVNKRYSTQQVRTDRLSMEMSLRFGFVLPDGNRLHMEWQSLGEPWAFRPYGSPPRDDTGPKEPFQLAPAQTQRAIAIALNDPEIAAPVIEAIRANGFNEIWLQTTNPAVLSQTLKAGVPVRLVVRPWLATPSDANQDMTLLGYSNQEMRNLTAHSLAFQETANRMSAALDLLRYPPQFSPDSRTASRWDRLAGLAQTPGLAGVIVLDTRPRGYEPDQTSARSMDSSFSEALNYGFTPTLRYAFLRESHVDPIDITPPYLFFDSDLRQPFFLDDNLRGSSSVYDGRDQVVSGFEDCLLKWQKFRANANQSAIAGLLRRLAQALGDRPLLIDVSQKFANAGITPMKVVTPWKPGDPMPEFEQPNAYFRQPTPNDKTLFHMALEPVGYEERNIRDVLFQMTKPEFKYEISMDFTAVPSNQLLKALAKWFKPAQAGS